MKPKIIPVNSEIHLSDEDVIVSKTDLQGRITYANRVFMRIANYSERDLLHIQHNIVRHPDMPRGAFKFLWDTLKQEKEFFGFVKNMASDGRYYWVFANVTPDYDASGNVIGYFSVRRKAKPDAIKVVEGLYREMIAIEQRVGPARACDQSIAFLVSKLKELNTGYDQLALSLQGV